LIELLIGYFHQKKRNDRGDSMESDIIHIGLFDL